MHAKVVMTFAVVLLLLGIGMFFGTGATSPTALIPAVFGGLLLLTGALAQKQHLHWRATVGTTVIALVGCLSTIVSLMTYSEVVGPIAIASKVVMAALCGLLVLLCVQSFWRTRQSAAHG